MSKRWQITIDRDIREKLGVKPGMRAVQDIMNGVLVVTFVPARHKRSLVGFLGPSPRQPTGTWEEQMEEVERAIAEDAMRES